MSDFNALKFVADNAGLNIFKALEKAYEQGVADATPKWIPCSKRLPKEGHDVLITKEPLKIKGYKQEVIRAKRSVDPRSGQMEWWSPEFGALDDEAVLAWMPLPEPWKGETDGQTG